MLNAIHTQGTLVVEVICQHDSEESREACGGYRATAAVPKVGEQVRVTGSYVTDRDNGWNEIHPVSSIEVVR